MIQVKMLSGQRGMLERTLNKTLRQFPKCLIANGYPEDAKYSIVSVEIRHSMSGGNDLAYIVYDVQGPHIEDGEPPHGTG